MSNIPLPPVRQWPTAMPANYAARNGAAPYRGAEGTGSLAYSRPAALDVDKPFPWHDLTALFAVLLPFLGLQFLFGDFSTLCPPDDPGHGQISGHGEIKAEIDRGGHCRSRAWAATAGGAGEFSAELDSGAGAALWLTRNDAARIGIDSGSLHFDQRYRGVSGPGRAAYVVVKESRLGGLVLSDLPAYVVSETDGVGEALVGLPILQRLNYRVVDASCVLSW